MKKALCILLALLMAGCTVPAAQSEEAPQPPIEDVVLETTEPVAQPEEEPLEGIWSEELTVLMEEINAEHRAVEKPLVSAETYDQYFPERETLPLPTQPDTELMVYILTQEQAIYDVSYLCYFLSANYALYDFFGGNERFEQAQADMIDKIKIQEQWSPTELMMLIVKHMDFVQDCHFVVMSGSQSASPVVLQYPIFYRNVEFVRVEDGFATADGKQVQSVEGQDDLEALFKRSLSIDGDIVYYPVLFSKQCANEEYNETPGDLVIHYDDGRSETLQGEPYDKSYIKKELSNDIQFDRVERIKRMIFKKFMNSNLATAGTELQGEPVVLIDVRTNGGGNADYGWRFWESYTGTKTSGNHLICFARQANNAMNDRYGVGLELLDGRPIMNTKEDTMTEMDNLTIILSGKDAYSAAEDFVDATHNVENTLIIGENTAGCLTSGAISQKSLRYSNIHFSYAESATIWPEGQFSEGYGLEPDLWCPAVYAEEAAINFLKKNVQ